MSTEGRWARVKRLTVVDIWLSADYEEAFIHNRALLNARCNNHGKSDFEILDLDTGEDITPENLNRPG